MIDPKKLSDLIISLIDSGIDEDSHFGTCSLYDHSKEEFLHFVSSIDSMDELMINLRDEISKKILEIAKSYEKEHKDYNRLRNE